ncbi:MAG: iron ABC transporter permease, partial [Muribaculaceae bacterium]|nr:iron ABC transporter permease [Muribaculaceae bacterium]
MKRTAKFLAVISILLAIAVIIVCTGVGSVFVPPVQIIKIFFGKLFGTSLDGVPEANISIIWEIRFPRVLMGFLVGAALSVSGAAVQSVLKNPLASPYTLGVSSGASLGAGIVIAGEFYFLGNFSLPAAGWLSGVAAMFLMVWFSAKIDRSLQGTTIVLTGMVLSLFVNGIVTLMANIADEKYKQIMKWQTGSFSGRKWDSAAILAAVLALSLAVMLCKAREMDLLTFGDEQARSVGLNARSAKILLLITAAVLSGTAVAFAGVIGFVDLIAPHVARRLFGAKHRVLLPMSALIGGVFTVLCDLAARTLTA